MSKNPNIITIADSWPKSSRATSIILTYATGKTTYPYGDSSERRDQYHNAIHHAQRLLNEGYGLYVDDQVDAITPRKLLNAVVVNGYIVKHDEPKKKTVLFVPKSEPALVQAVKRIDWASLSLQKQYLLVRDSDEADGLIALIDALQDAAIHDGIASEYEVFPFLTVDN